MFVIRQTLQFLCVNHHRCFSTISPFTKPFLDKLHSHFNNISLRKLSLTTAKSAAVFVPLCSVNNEPSILFTKRAETLRKHSGQVSFPGGLIEEIDKGDYIQTAIRETMEELGLQLEREENILIPYSKYHETFSTSSIKVVPVVGYIKNLQIKKMIPNDEVDEIFTISIKDLLDINKQSKRTLTISNSKEHESRVQLKVYNGGKYPVWGLTSYITEQILKEIQKI